MGDGEAWSSGHVESLLGYHSCIADFLTCGRESGRGTLLDGQFDWGGRLQKSNGDVYKRQPVAKAACWTLTDAEARKRGEQTGLDTLVVHAVNDEYLSLIHIWA